MASDSDFLDDDLLTNNGAFQNGSTIVSVKGPNVDMTNITGLSFRNNAFSSTMQMPMPFERPRYAESSYNQRSLSNRREVSPFSVRSAYDMGHRNHSNYSFNFRGLGARSVLNGRSGSPMSVKTIDTSATVSAGDIIQAIRNEQFRKREIKDIIVEACNILSRNQKRKKKHEDSYDSGEMGSNSSLSDDNRSTVTSNYRNYMSSSRSAITDISKFKRKMTTSNMFHNRTGNFRFNPDQNKPRGQMNWNTSQTSFRSSQSVQGGAKMSSVKNMPLQANFNTQEKNAPTLLLKDRFNSGYRLQSQRFNKSTIPSSIPENVENGLEKETHTQNGNLATNNKTRNNIETDCDEDNIFSNTTTQKQPNNYNRKRSMEGEDTFQPNQKRFKPLSPCKNSIEGLRTKKLKSCKGKSNDFIFAKPVCPVRKPVKEKLISKSAAPLSDNIPVITVMPPEIEHPNEEKPIDEERENLEDESNSTNLSMRPSFIKRKLFTQNLDITEKRNLSADNLNSPQNSVYGAIQKERHKARKLQQATTQSCLSRDVEKDGNDHLELLQKIVPQINLTNQTNKTASQSKNTTEKDDKWDISTNSPRKNDDNVSDTYTDEEILNSTVRELQKSSKKNKETVKKDAPTKVSPAKTKSCKISIEKLPATLLNSQAITKHFWDTDIESDLEFPSPKIDKLNIKENRRPDLVPQKKPTEAQGLSSNLSSKKPVAASGSSQNYTFDTTQNFNSTLRIRSHNALKRNKLDHKLTDTKSTLLNNTERKREKDQVNNCIKVSHDIPNEEELTKIENKKSVEKASKGKKKENIATEKDNKSPKSKKREESVTRKNTSTKNDHKKSPKGKVQQKIATKNDKNPPKGKNKLSKTDKQNHHTQNQKPIESKYDNTKTLDKKTDRKLRTTPQKPNTSDKENIVENSAQTKKMAMSKKNVEPKVASNKLKKTNDSSIIEENNKNISNRTRSRSRTNTNNQTMKANTANVKETMNQTLRSSKLNSSNKNNVKPEQKDDKYYTRLSDVSFTLVAEKNILAKRAVKKTTNSRLSGDDSDLSFSLTPTPRKTRSTIRNSTLNSTPLNKTFSQNKNLNISGIRQSRCKLPNKRYIF